MSADRPPDNLHERIRWARHRVGLSQEALADQIGTSRRHVIRWERDTAPGPWYRHRLAEVLNQTPEFFEEASVV